LLRSTILPEQRLARARWAPGTPLRL
jgi:hypothetical protein